MSRSALAQAAVADDQLERLGDHRLRAGMPADDMIKIGVKTSLPYLFEPLMGDLQNARREE